MTPVSHALLPIFFGQPWLPRKDGVPAPRAAMLVGFCGALPDVLSPHLSLDGRYAALSHTWWALLLFTGVIAILRWRAPRLFTSAISLLCIAAYAGHLFCDGITGGIAFKYPFDTAVFGKNYLPYWLWSASDCALFMYFYLIYRWLPLRRKANASRVRVTAPTA